MTTIEHESALLNPVAPEQEFLEGISKAEGVITIEVTEEGLFMPGYMDASNDVTSFAGAVFERALDLGPAEPPKKGNEGDDYDPHKSARAALSSAKKRGDTVWSSPNVVIEQLTDQGTGQIVKALDTFSGHELFFRDRVYRISVSPDTTEIAAIKDKNRLTDFRYPNNYAPQLGIVAERPTHKPSELERGLIERAKQQADS